MSHIDALILSGLTASVWVHLAVSADRLVAEAGERAGRNRPSRLLRWAKAGLATLSRGRRYRGR